MNENLIIFHSIVSLSPTHPAVRLSLRPRGSVLYLCETKCEEGKGPTIWPNPRQLDIEEAGPADGTVGGRKFGALRGENRPAKERGHCTWR